MSLEDRSLIEAARGELSPSDEERRRLRRSVLAAAGAAAGTAAASGTAAATTTATGLATWKTVALVVTGLTLAGGAGWGVVASTSTDDAASGASAARGAGPSAATAGVEPREAREGTAPADEAISAADPSTGEAARTALAPSVEAAPDPGAVASEAGLSAPRIGRAGSVGRVASAGRAEPAPPADVDGDGDAPSPRAASAAGDALDAETALLRQAHAALRAGDAAEALARLDAHATRFPRGFLSEERDATRALALCDAGRAVEARRLAEAFLRGHPGTVYEDRLRASCALE